MCALFRGHEGGCDATPITRKQLTNRRWREANKVKVKAAYNRFYSYKNNREKVAAASVRHSKKKKKEKYKNRARIAYDKQRYLLNIEERLAASNCYNNDPDNADKIISRRKNYRVNNRDKIKAYNKAYYRRTGA
jgi:hypothetical protein